MVRAWIADVTPLYEKRCYDKYYSLLPDFRKKKADALRSQEMKAQSVGVWSLWQQIRAEYGLTDDISYNLSHSGTFVMCAAELDGRREQVGCDLEKIGQLKENIAGRFFCREEYERIIREETEEQQNDCFFRFWVLKESFLKATRRGMALPLNSFCVELNDPPRLARQPAEYPEFYYYREYTVENIPCKMAVCSTDRDIDSEIENCAL